MRLSSTVCALFAGLATAAPVEERTSYGVTANEYVNGPCKDVILFFARGTQQTGNLGDMPGEQLATALSTALGSSVLAVQGVNNYSASLDGNYDTGGCPPAAATAWATTLTQASTKCPDAQIVVAGYSQGAAMVHRALEDMTTSVVTQHIAAAVTFGDTQKKQDGGVIPNIAVNKTKIFCNKGDLVCFGTLDITSAHLDYLSSVDPAVTFIQSVLS